MAPGGGRAAGSHGAVRAGARSDPAAAMASAEVAAAEVVRRVQPTQASDRRRAVVDHARRIVGTALGCEVFVFGSVPLKTYLPDGDIDLTVIGNTSCGSTLIDDVYHILESGEENGDAEFEVKDLEHIDAEVRLIKCTIGNIIVDISFNQTGGLCAVSFLELVDRKVGKNHLFKRSIILIKGWCYYESRLLGAHHGLISTYALETLILYVFNLFHKSLHGPLEVLYRFLEYFSKFDWDKYCISLNGPVALSSLPNLIVEGLNVPGDDLLFDREFLDNSVEKASAPPRNSDARCSKFRVKCLNIIDPLKECNNLGRSVNRANFHRIRTAFSFGARKLGQILMLPPELIPDDIFAFFKNTLERNENGVRSDIDHVANQLLDDMSCMQISYKEDEKSRPRVSKTLAEHAGGCFPGDDSLAASTDLSARLSHCVHHEPNDHAYVFHENRNGATKQYYVAAEMDGEESRYAAEASMGDKSLIQPQHHAHYSSHILHSIHGRDLGLPKPGPIKKENLTGTSLHVEDNLHPLSLLNLSDLSGDLESQLRCLRQVQYNLEYLFDEFSQSAQEASSDCKVDKDLFEILNRGILLSTDKALPGLLPPSYTETNGMKLSPVSSHSTEVSQQSQDEDNWGVPFQLNACGIDVPSNGLSPSYIADSDISVSWWHRSEAIPNMRETVGYIHEKNMASIGEKGKVLINQPVQIEINQATIPKRSFEIRISRSLGIGDGLNGYARSGMKKTEKHSGHTRKEFVKPHCDARHTRSFYGDVSSNKTFFQKRNYDTGMECALPVSAKYQPTEVEGTPDEWAYMNNNFLARNQICDTPKGHATNRRLTSEPLKLQSSMRGRGFSKKNLAAKQKYDDHSGHPSFVRDTKHAPNVQVVTILNGSTKDVALSEELIENGTKPRPLLPNVFIPHDSRGNNQRIFWHLVLTQQDRIIEFGSLGPFSLTSPPQSQTRPHQRHVQAPLVGVGQSYRAGATQNRSSGFYRIGDEEQFPPLHARTR
ncbi:hypothetical protein ZWY2020_029230 [Hordeum vulgare]|nr:hypothetical protein ZWY2020_029230 [Hordeum vulgare]